MLVGNKKVKTMLDDIVQAKDCSHAYLFVGPSGAGKTTFAVDFAKNLICEDELACGVCRNCLLFDSGNHPDVIVNDEDESMTVEKMREVIESLSLKPYQASKKIFLLANAERMTISAANSLLKTLEEPAKETIIILTSSNPALLLPTITSRVQQIKFTNVKDEELRDFLSKEGCVSSEEIVSLSLSRVGLAKELSENQENREELTKFLLEFDETISSEQIWEKLKFAEVLAKKKEEIPLYLDLLESFYARKLHAEGDDVLKISSILDKLSRTRDLLSKNVNNKLVFEALLLGDIL